MDSKERVEYYKRKVAQDPGNAEMVFHLAKAYTESNKWDKAINYFQKSIELDCHHIKSYLELSNLLFTIDKIDKAVEVCQLGIDYNPESSALYYLLEQLYEVLGEYELASQTLEDLIRIDEDYNKAYEALGRLAILQNRFDEALVWLEKLIQQEPENINAFIYLANIHRKKKNFDLSIEYLLKAKEIDASNLDVYNDLGLLYLEFGQLDKAKENFEYVVSQDETYSFAFDNLGVIYRKLKEYDKAEEALKQSLSINLQAWTCNELALVYTEKGNYKKSIESSKKALAIDPEYAYAYDNLGAVYRKLGYFDKAEEALNYSVTLKPEDSWTYNQLGLLNYENGRYVTARANFTRSFNLDTEHYWPCINIASCYIKEKDYLIAESYLDELENKYPDIARVYMLKSRMKYLLNQMDDAIKNALKAIEKDKDDPMTYSNLAMLYREQENYEKACEYFERALICSRPVDSSVYLEYALLEMAFKNYEKALSLCHKARQIDELNYNIYCIMAIIQKCSNIETRLMDFIRDVEKRFSNTKEVFMAYACIFLELGLPEESEKYFNLALRSVDRYPEALYGLAQTYHIMKLYDKSLEFAFMNTDNLENNELASYNIALVALNYQKINNTEKQQRYTSEAIKMNATIQKEFYQKYKIRMHLTFKPRRDLFLEMSELFTLLSG
jgi:tetratricopeptide (TPR) repeat protein